MNTIRSFIALKIPEYAIHKIEETQNKIKKLYSPDVRWTPSENLHITLAFPGSRTQKELDIIISSMPDLSPFLEKSQPLSNGFIDFFGSYSHPKILFFSFSSFDKKLDELANTVQHHSFSKPEKRWIPHITIGRFRESNLKRDITFLKEFKNIEISFHPEKVILYSSLLKKSGPLYSPICEFEQLSLTFNIAL